VVSRSNSRRGFGAIAVASFAVLGLGLASPAQAVQATQGAWSGRAAQPGQPDRSITLITGDRVTLRGGSLDRPAIEPGPRRRHIAFSTQRVKDQLFVVPSDVSSAVTAGRMDRRLFEVAGLIKAGYDDRQTSVIPLLVTYSGRAASRTAPAGATMTRQLPVINGAAVEVTKKDAATFVRNLSTARSANGLDKI
jgi:hypothetical protein